LGVSKSSGRFRAYMFRLSHRLLQIWRRVTPLSLARAREYQIVPTAAPDAAPFPTSQALTTWDTALQAKQLGLAQ